MKEYVIVRRSFDQEWYDKDDGLKSLARTVYEEEELIDIGIMDARGDPIMARRKKDPIGFIYLKERH